MNITDYVKNYGHQSFDERPFNEVDALIMAQMGYLNWELIVPRLESKNKWPVEIKTISDGINVELNEGEFDSKRSEKLFLEMKKSVRFGKMKARFVRKHDDAEILKQFFAVTLTLPNGMNIISIRGTDMTLNGWKEDCALTFMNVIPSQEEVVKYVEEVAQLIKGSFYIVGHSKGGNLAHYAAIKIKPKYRRRLVASYSFDGPGFHDDSIFKTREFESANKKLIKYIPRDSVVGIVLNTNDNAFIVDSTNLSVLQHDPFSWKVTKDLEFKKVKRRLASSVVNERTLSNFLGELSLDERREITDALFEMLGQPHESFISLFKNIPRTVKHFVKKFGSYPKEERKKLIWALYKLIDSYRKAVFSFLKRE